MQPMMITSAQDVYRKQGVLTAGPMELIVMLYDGLKKNLLLAKRSMKKDDIEASHNCLIKAQDIVTELVNCLDMGIPMSKDLLALYDYILFALGDINLKKDPEMIDPVVAIVQSLKETWEEIGSQQKGSLSLIDD